MGQISRKAVILLMVFAMSISGGFAMAVSNEQALRLEDFRWQKRVVLVFVQDAAALQGVARRFERERFEIEDRDIRYFLIDSEMVSNGTASFSPEYREELRTRFARDRQEMTVVLIGKDGGVKYREDHLDLEAVFQEIDAMPMRQREMQRSRTTLFDFSNPLAIEGWKTVNDVVMGGISDSRMVLTDSGTAVFQGTVSLENQGGFASVRKLGLDHDLGGYEGLLVRIQGDGKKYQLRVRTDEAFDGIAYRYLFETEPGIWNTVRAPFSEFVPVFRGRRVEDAPLLDPGQIKQIGFLIAHKQEGPFRLEIDKLEVYR